VAKRTYAESPNLTDGELLEAGYDRLEELSVLRRIAAASGREVWVRHASTAESIGYVYGLSVPGDWPAWRGTLEEIEEMLSR
jgi:hypothetical protein